MSTLRACHTFIGICIALFSAHAMSNSYNGELSDTCEATFCSEVGELNFGLGFGVGVRTNPLYQSKNIPLYIVPDLSWYSDNWYLDNTEVGYQWHQSADYAIETFISLNPMFSSFRRGSVSNLILDSGLGGLPNDSDISGGVSGPNETDSPPMTDLPTEPEENTDPDSGGSLAGENSDQASSIRFLSPEDVNKRDIAFDIGTRLHWYQGDGEWIFTSLYDASNVHNGSQLSVKYKHRLTHYKWRFSASLSATWRSANLLNYYFGVSQSDINDRDYHYNASSGIYANATFSVARQITDKWSFLAHLSYTDLPKAVVDSPLVDQDYTLITFVGATYRF